MSFLGELVPKICSLASMKFFHERQKKTQAFARAGGKKIGGIAASLEVSPQSIMKKDANALAT